MNANRQFIMENFTIAHNRYVEFYNNFVEMLDLNSVETYMLQGLLEQLKEKTKAEMLLDENGITSDEAIQAQKIRSIGA